jgi:chromosomal replication initiation ATPase DnaA
MTLGTIPPFNSSEIAFDQNSSLWMLCLQQLAQELPEQQFNTWIKPLKVDVAMDGSKVIIWIANRFKLDWIRAQYLQHITALLEKFNGQPIKLELALVAKDQQRRNLHVVGIVVRVYRASRVTTAYCSIEQVSGLLHRIHYVSLAASSSRDLEHCNEECLHVKELA